MQQARPKGLIDLSPQARDMNVDHVVKRRRAVRLPPHIASKHLPRYNSVAIPHEKFQQLELPGREF
jgi:hypothetical protein